MSSRQPRLKYSGAKREADTGNGRKKKMESPDDTEEEEEMEVPSQTQVEQHNNTTTGKGTKHQSRMPKTNLKLRMLLYNPLPHLYFHMCTHRWKS